MELMVIAEKWANSIRLKDPELQASYYDYNAILLPTFDVIEVGVDSIYWYFTQFLNKTDLQCGITMINTLMEGKIECSTGLYVFSFVEEGRVKEVEARFTFVSSNNKIVSHHSSLKPKNE